MKRLMTVVAAGAALNALAGAVPVVSEATMTQPSNTREVTITYTLADADAVVTLDVQTNATDGAWVSIGGENIQRVTGDVWKKVAPGARTITWRPDLSWPDHKIAEGGARAVVTAWSVDNPPDYMVVDLTENAVANSETYYPAVEFLPGGLLGNDNYRTSKLVMRKIPAKGVEWTMGSAETELGHKSNEKAHTVKLDDNYYIGVFETTQAQWSYVQTANPTPSYHTTERAMRPVNRVCFNEIRNNADRSTTENAAFNWPAAPNPDSFLGLLRTKTGLLFDLPSEAQWEFACRAGHGTGYWGDGSPILSSDQDANLALLGRVYYNGGKVLKDNGEYADPDASCGVTNGTAIVGSYAPNDWGLYDMNGNVWEYCLDWYEDNISAHGGAVNINPDNAAQTRSGKAGTLRPRRGGSSGTGANYSLAAVRNTSTSHARDAYVGFRLALPACVSGQQ